MVKLGFRGFYSSFLAEVLVEATEAEERSCEW